MLLTWLIIDFVSIAFCTERLSKKIPFSNLDPPPIKSNDADVSIESGTTTSIQCHHKGSLTNSLVNHFPESILILYNEAPLYFMVSFIV